GGGLKGGKKGARGPGRVQLTQRERQRHRLLLLVAATRRGPCWCQRPPFPSGAAAPGSSSDDRGVLNPPLRFKGSRNPRRSQQQEHPRMELESTSALPSPS